MKPLSRKIREFGQLGLLFFGFLTGIALVVTCGGGGAGGQGGTSTSSTISFTPFFFNVSDPTAADPNNVVGVPPVLRNVTNVQDALNRLNAVLSPDLARLTDPLSAGALGQPGNPAIPQVLVDPGDPNNPNDDFILSFSRGLAGLVRSNALAGPIRADDAFFLSCDETAARNNIVTAPIAARLFCDTPLGSPMGEERAVFELFRPSTLFDTNE
ncbi:MAG: hypothetical protein KDB53_08725, partial [Planctomycetes bacterium]|nr:hypothetical protein [Planctomycetota bacterium]